MNTTMGQRLHKALVARAMEPKDLIDRTGLSRGAVYFILNDTTSPEKVRAETVANICKALRISKDWLLHDRGEMDAPSAALTTADDWIDVPGYAQAVSMGSGAQAVEYAETHALKFKISSLRRKGLLDKKLSVFYGDGDSMLPRIQTGDALLFDEDDKKPRDETIFVILWKGEYFAKMCEILDDVVYFKSLNAQGDHHWRKAKRKDAERDPIEIVGRVRWIGSWED